MAGRAMRGHAPDPFKACDLQASGAEGGRFVKISSNCEPNALRKDDRRQRSGWNGPPNLSKITSGGPGGPSHGSSCVALVNRQKLEVCVKTFSRRRAAIRQMSHGSNPRPSRKCGVTPGPKLAG